MTFYYFDTETEGFDPKIHKLLTVQFQELDSIGNPKGKLIILKEWEIGEELLVKSIHKTLVEESIWQFVPVLTNHIFDFTFLFKKFNQYNLPCPKMSEWLFTKPFIDIKYSLIMANNLSFKGSGLNNVTKKPMDGRLIPQWYRNKEYNKIEDYIKEECECFMEFFIMSILSLKGVKDKLKPVHYATNK